MFRSRASDLAAGAQGSASPAAALRARFAGERTGVCRNVAVSLRNIANTQGCHLDRSPASVLAFSNAERGLAFEKALAVESILAKICAVLNLFDWPSC